MYGNIRNIGKHMDIYNPVGNIEIYRYVMPAIESNMYVIFDGDKALIVDPNMSEELFEELDRRNISDVTAILTHEHIDHICGLNELRDRINKVKVICSEKCAERIKSPKDNLAKFWDVIIMDRNEADRNLADEMIDRNYTCTANETYEDNKEYEFVSHRIRLISAPGHSPGGSIIFLDDTVVFTGDNLVEGNGVITRFPGGNKKDFWNNTAQVIDGLEDCCYIFPGHGKPGRMLEMRKFLVDYKRPIYI